MKRTIKIKIRGQLEKSWEDWFDGFDFVYEGNNTIFLVEERDEAFLHGVLNKIRDLNLKLISVDTIDESNKY